VILITYIVEMKKRSPVPGISKALISVKVFTRKSKKLKETEKPKNKNSLTISEKYPFTLIHLIA